MPRELSTVFGFRTTPDGEPVFGIDLCWSGEPDAGAKVMERLRAVAPPDAEDIRVMTYPALQSMLDAGSPPGMQSYCTAEYVRTLDDNVIAALVDAGETLPSAQSQLHIVPLGGAVAETPQGGSAFGHRDAPYVANILALWDDPRPSATTAGRAWAQATWSALHATAGAGTYVNFLGEDDDRVRAAYAPAVYDRLVDVKRTYDPDNVFRVNHNIPPG